MKKLVLLMALILAAGLCFAQDDGEEAAAQPKPETFDLEITIGVPIHWTNSPTPHNFITTQYDEDKTVTANTAIGVALLFNFGRKIGFTLDFDFFFGSDVMGHSPTDSYSNTLFGVNALLGPVIYLYNGNFLRIPLALGVHVYYWSSDAWVNDNWLIGTPGAWHKTRDLQLGPGFYLGIQFHFNDHIYIFSRTNVALDLFRWHQLVLSDGSGVGKESEVEFAIGWQVKPTIGIGVKF